MKKKLKWWQILLIILGTLFVIGLIMDLSGYTSTPEWKAKEESRAIEESLTKESIDKKWEERKQKVDNALDDLKNEMSKKPYTILSANYDNSNPYYPQVVGTVRCDKDGTSTAIRAEFYDANGVVIGTGLDYLSKMTEGQVYQFKIYATCDPKQVANWRLKE